MAAPHRSDAGVGIHTLSRPGPIPARAGIGLRAAHHTVLLSSRPRVAWLEAHSENYFVDGGSQLACIEQLRAHYPISLHGVGLSLGGVDELDREHLRRLKRLVDRIEPAFVSEHASWGSHGGVYLNDLLPLPRTDEALRHLARHVAQLQDHLGRQVLMENVSSYLEFTVSTLTEPQFLAALAAESGCALLLDVNNVYVSARNHGWDVDAYLAQLPADRIHEIHVAGHSVRRIGTREILIDTHASRVSAGVWALYERALEHFGAVPTLIEWDAELPSPEVLVDEARRADRRLERINAVAA